MNIVTGSSGGLGRYVYEELKKLNLPVFGIDILDCPTTDLLVDLSELKNIKNLSKKIDSKIDSITFTHAAGNSKNEINKFNLNQFRYINAESNLDLLEEFKASMNNNASIVFISSVHSIATNKQSGGYSTSKAYLENLYRYICLDDSKINFNKCLLRIGAMDTKMLSDNVEDLNQLKLDIPSKKIIDPKDLANFIVNIHLNFKHLLNCSVLQIDGGVLFKLGTE